MNAAATLLFALGASMLAEAASADIFTFSDPTGYETCMKTDHMVETVKNGNTAQSRYLTQLEIQERCTQAATKLVAKNAKKDVVAAYIKVTFRNGARVNAIDLINVLVGVDPVSCNETDNYDVLMQIFSAPKSDDALSLYQRGKAMARTCLKDKTFKQDFKDELGSTPGSYRFDAVCEVLREQKIVSTCKKA